MKQVDNFSLQVVRESQDTQMGEYNVLFDGNITGINVPYCVLEAAVKVDEDLFLLFLTDDVPFEEMLHIALIHMKQGILEMIDLGGAYTTGSFKHLEIENDRVNFHFIGDTTWTVRIAEKPFFRMPFTGDPRGISRPMAMKHYILISADPPPARADGSR
ncbi:hypothetical protein [Mangrovibacter phragmitis]|uniref:hypothetical protein n=1 Tax=Mangrovibacter phragmitis TaxID=1691903 RepID=UPI0035162A67